ncbi:MAG: UDP-glucose/GDP-mannose dehydrogenase family protein [Gammaproteobacteria bacterium]|nr:UDP-glucose/GDP-mannose dehydrogenase family protein [Gammaproteobacteria bacterium]
MKVCVQGLWHLGSVTAASLAAVGHKVVGLDFDAVIIQGLQAGKPPIFEPGLEDMIREGLDSGKLEFTKSLDNLPDDIEILWVAYDTPVNDDDVADVDFVVSQLEKTLPYLGANAIVLVSSQMPVGSIRRIEAIADRCCPEKALSFACSPENLRLGKALYVFLKPDRVVVGVRNTQDKERIGCLLQSITDRIEWMSVESAEMTKHAINAFLATSVVFANEIASVCEMVGADAKEVERGLKSEQRIGPKAYLSPGGAFAGGTLARDIEFLKVVSSEHKLSIPLLESVKTSNDQHKRWVRRKLNTLFSCLHGVTVVVWGLTYKPGTDTLRRSLAVELCNWLLEQGAKVRVHDPAVKVLPPEWHGIVTRFDAETEALVGAQVLLVGTEWPKYKEVSIEHISGLVPDLVVLDPNRFLSTLGSITQLRYFAVGTPSC